MRSLKVSKYIFRKYIFALILYYFILITVFLIQFIFFKNGFFKNISAMEGFIGIIFLFIGANAIMEDFNFISGFNLSKGDYLKGIILGIIPLVLLGAFIDLIISNTAVEALQNSESFLDLICLEFKNNIIISFGNYNVFKFIIAVFINLFSFFMGLLMGLLMKLSNKVIRNIIFFIFLIGIILTVNFASTEILGIAKVIIIFFLNFSIIGVVMSVLVLGVFFYLLNMLLKKAF